MAPWKVWEGWHQVRDPFQNSRLQSYEVLLLNQGKACKASKGWRLWRGGRVELLGEGEGLVVVDELGFIY